MYRVGSAARLSCWTVRILFPHGPCRHHPRRPSHSSSPAIVSIGGVNKPLKTPKHIQLVPKGYLPADGQPSQSILQDLRWILQKDILGQDVYLIGPPGPTRRRLAFQYSELVEREVEYVALSRDTTESDLKQRREIRAASATYFDQAAVKAAIEGRTLVLDGIEKAERNVLPVLNNLLENREMQLEDGRFLVAPHTYDKLLAEHSKETLDRWKLVRVSEDFRVIALGLPVPRYRGNPLDPPLRSRFQSRHVAMPPYQDLVTQLQQLAQNAPPHKIKQLASFAYAVNNPESELVTLPDFPVENLRAAALMLNAVPSLDLHTLVGMLYPFEAFLQLDQMDNLKATLKKFDIPARPSSQSSEIIRISHQPDGSKVELKVGGKKHTLTVPGTSTKTPAQKESSSYVLTEYHEHLLAQLLLSHSAHDFCIIGPKGCGKSALAAELARQLGRGPVETVALYQDMTARDLVQHRETDPNTGNTAWADSPLVVAARTGRLAVVDGLHRVHPGTLAVLHRLIHDREIQLYDGSRLIHSGRFEAIKTSSGLSDQDLNERGVYPIHPDFRIIALAEPPSVNGGGSSQPLGKWLHPETLSLFLFHSMRPLSQKEELQLISQLVSSDPGDDLKQVLEVTNRLRSSTDPALQSLAKSLSTRQVLRIARSLHSYPGQASAYDMVHKACLSRFLPSLTKQALEQVLSECGLSSGGGATVGKQGVGARVEGGQLHLGGLSVPVHTAGEDSVKVPNVLFYSNPQHEALLGDMLRDFTLGEHLLLVGNQGVGKNKLTDHFLQLLGRPREYIQLHRDTSVQGLTTQAAVRDGKVVFEESPLVKAVRYGRVLVVDEADKAPTHVTVLLKTLVESGAMLLADGRRILLPQDAAKYDLPEDKLVTMHPDFRMIVLANRPGFPFLGNDFYASLGDIFSVHAIDNPSPESELAMLQKYGPDVPREALRRLQETFCELRSLSDQGLLAYPYSTRELVNIVKHLQEFPSDSLQKAVRNVFDFDVFSNETKELLDRTLTKHGIPLGLQTATVRLAPQIPLGMPTLLTTWDPSPPISAMKEPLSFDLKRSFSLPLVEHDLNKTERRVEHFSEEQCYWTLPLGKSSLAVDLAVSKSGQDPFQDQFHVAAVNPFSLLTVLPTHQKVLQLDLNRLFPPLRSFRPQISLAALDKGTVFFYESETGQGYILDPLQGQASQLVIDSPSILDSAAKLLGMASPPSQAARPSLVAPDCLLLPSTENVVTQVDLVGERAWSIQLPFPVSDLWAASPGHWLLTDSSGQLYLARVPKESGPCEVIPLGSGGGSPCHVSSQGLAPHMLSAMLGRGVQSPNNRLLVTPNCYAGVAVGLPDLESPTEVFGIPRPKPITPLSTVSLPDYGQVVNMLPKVPPSEVGASTQAIHGYLEVVDLQNQVCRYLPVPVLADDRSTYSSYLAGTLNAGVRLQEASGGHVATADPDGLLHLWQADSAGLLQSLGEWHQMVGGQATDQDKLAIQKRKSGKPATGPKHGKMDPTGAPHVGGNTWAGGTGGRDTAGLGGVGGPYRLDAGHTVFQVSQEEKDAVPEHVRKAAREMAQKAYKDKLRELRMSKHNAELYDQLASKVRPQVRLLRNILDSLQAKSQERQWIRHQTSGDLDETKLVEGIAGERAVFRRRGELPPEPGAPQMRPKRLRLVVDMSGSMYRFNSHDGRLERQIEAMLMVMEAFQGYTSKFTYDIVGHSGETDRLQLTNAEKPPDNDRDRLLVLQTAFAHSQFCMSGDHTLKATGRAVRQLAADEANWDESFVVVLSDANLRRYGIHPSRLGKLMAPHNSVSVFAIFIGSLGDEADRLKQHLPAGRAFVCMDTAELPRILQHIFTSTLLRT